MKDVEALIKKAKQARMKAYVPFSTFKVGAAIQTKSGNIYTGCNIENSSYSLTCCAERTAIFKAISEGDTAFSSLTVIADTEDVVSPCGACRQVMAEFFKEDVSIYLTNLSGIIKQTSLKELLPFHFKL